MVDPRSIPTEDQLKAAGALKVLDSEGKEVSFFSFFEEHKTIVVFIREYTHNTQLMTVEDDEN